MVKEKYYADFEARDAILVGNQDIYQHNTPKYKRVRTEAGDFMIEDGGVVTMRANSGDGVSGVILGAGFSAKAGSIFRAYVYTDPNTLSSCNAFGYRMANMNTTPEAPAKESRPIISTKRGSTTNATKKAASIIAVYPNPTEGSVYYEIPFYAENFKYTITDVTGKELENGDLKRKVDLSHYDKGVYFITIFNGTIKQINRVILQ